MKPLSNTCYRLCLIFIFVGLQHHNTNNAQKHRPSRLKTEKQPQIKASTNRSFLYIEFKLMKVSWGNNAYLYLTMWAGSPHNEAQLWYIWSLI